MVLRIHNYGYLSFFLLLHAAITWEGTSGDYQDVFKRRLPRESKPKPNITEEDHHKYYKSTFYRVESVAMSYWVDLNKAPREKVLTARKLYTPVNLSFRFLYYGHLLNEVWIWSYGAIFTGKTGEYRLNGKQYICPLNAEYLKGSEVQYYDNGSALTVQWDKLRLDNQSTDEAFKFQATLFQNGDIVFVYKQIPVSPVSKVIGCSDSFIYRLYGALFNFRYHMVNLSGTQITGGNAFYLTALPTCLQYTDCNSCRSAKINFNCTWCEAAGKCSDGMSRYRQHWILKGCHEQASDCSAKQATYQGRVVGGLSTGELFIIYLAINLLILAGIWIVYAYKNPQSSSGQILIKYRPSQWFRRGEV